ncbi:MAG TPA: hypothetical protein VF498_12730 [Anaerolineales bacterium]
MDYREVQRVEYRGERWLGSQPHPALWGLLAARDRLVVLSCARSKYRVTLGVPHQASAGHNKICERRVGLSGGPSPRDADENSALYALVAFEALCARNIPCKLVVMAHATTHDPNKELDSPYCREIFAEPTALLFECHGAGRSRPPLELSAGSNPLADPVAFGRELAAGLDYRYPLSMQKKDGDGAAVILKAGGAEAEGVLELPANRTPSLIEAGRLGIPALHLEAQPAFRKPVDSGNALTEDGRLLGLAIAQAVMAYPA